MERKKLTKIIVFIMVILVIILLIVSWTIIELPRENRIETEVKEFCLEQQGEYLGIRSHQCRFYEDNIFKDYYIINTSRGYKFQEKKE